MNRKYLVTFNVDNYVGSMYVLSDRRPTAEDITGFEKIVRKNTKKKGVVITNLIEIDMSKEEKRKFAFTTVLYALFLLVLGVACMGLILAFLWLLSNVSGRGVII